MLSFEQELIGLLRELEQQGLVSEIQPLWIVNSIRCYATQEVVHGLKGRSDIQTIYPCKELHGLFDDETTLGACDNRREIAENLLKVCDKYPCFPWMANWDGVFATDERQACIFPNPSTEDITVTCEGMHQIEVFSMEGRLVKSIQTASPVHHSMV